MAETIGTVFAGTIGTSSALAVVTAYTVPAGKSAAITVYSAGANGGLRINGKAAAMAAISTGPVRCVLGEGDVVSLAGTGFDFVVTAIVRDN